MRQDLALSVSLMRLVDSSRYTVGHRADGLAISGGEIGRVVSEGAAGLVVKKWERAEEPYPVMPASSFVDVERWVVMSVGDAARTKLGFDPIWLPWPEGEAASGFAVTDMGALWFSIALSRLYPPDASPVIELESGGINAAVAFSHIATISVDALVESYLDPGGGPALRPFVRRDKETLQ